jgi:3-oxoacyl-[acyl-carrier protein] reductase
MATVIVTGSGRGIGREAAILLAKRGMNVVVCSRTQQEIDETVDAIKQIHASVLGVRCDVSVSSQVDSLIKKTASKFGDIDILVNNAGIAVVKSLLDTTGAGKTGFENLSAYCASKFGMMGLTESLAWEVAGHNNIRVMVICPGEVATRMQEVDPDYYWQNKGRMLQPEQVAAKIVEMIFDKSRYKNGQSIDI